MPRKLPASRRLPTRLVTTKFVNTTFPRQSAVREKRTVAAACFVSNRPCEYLGVMVRRQEPSDYEAAQLVYAEAFKRPDHPERIPPEVGLFSALWEAKDVINELSFTAMAENDVVGHVTASCAKVSSHSVVAVGPIGVLPEHQGKGIGSALMSALLDAASFTAERNPERP
jgi:GNAT superfamily N-acetyltransferase